MARKNKPKSGPSTVATNSEPTSRMSLQRAEFKGPLPPPQILQQYNDIVPGAAERILSMAEDMASHQRDIQSRAIDIDSMIVGSDNRARTSGQWMAFGIVILSFSLTALGAWMEKPEIQDFFSKTSLGGIILIVLAFLANHIPNWLMKRSASEEP